MAEGRTTIRPRLRAGARGGPARDPRPARVRGLALRRARRSKRSGPTPANRICSRRRKASANSSAPDMRWRRRSAENSKSKRRKARSTRWKRRRRPPTRSPASSNPGSKTSSRASSSASTANATGAEAVRQPRDHHLPHAGGHPDLSTSFTLGNPGEPEVARNITFRAPEGVFGNPNAVSECASSEFALDRCSADSQVGLITVYANYKGNPDELLGTAPIFALEPVEEETALLAFIAPELNIPISIPVTVRTESDYGLNLTVSDITQLVPLAGVNLTIWGFPAIPAHDAERFPKGSPGEPSNCPELANTACIGAPTASSLPPMPAHRQPDQLHRGIAARPRSKSRPTGTRATSRPRNRTTRRPPDATSRSSTPFSSRARPPRKATLPRA